MFFGNASEMDAKKLQTEMSKVLNEGENIERAFKLVRDMFIFTNKRLILVDKQGMINVKIEYHSIPYKSITHFSVETAAGFDGDADLKIWITGSQVPLERELKKGVDVINLQRMLAHYIAK